MYDGMQPISADKSYINIHAIGVQKQKDCEDIQLACLQGALETARQHAASQPPDLEQGSSYVAPELVEGLQRPFE